MGLIYTNEENITEMKNNLNEKDAQILEINKQFIDFLEQYEEQKKQLKEKFSDTNKKISKINYMGITGKFDKMQKEQNKKLTAKVDEVEDKFKEKMENIRQDLYSSEKSLLDKINGLNEIIINNQKVIDGLKNKKNNTNKTEDNVNAKEITEALSNKLKKIRTENIEAIEQIQKQVEEKGQAIKDLEVK